MISLMSASEKSAFMATGRKAVIAGSTGIPTHQAPIHSTVPSAALTFMSSAGDQNEQEKQSRTRKQAYEFVL